MMANYYAGIMPSVNSVDPGLAPISNFDPYAPEPSNTGTDTTQVINTANDEHGGHGGGDSGSGEAYQKAAIEEEKRKQQAILNQKMAAAQKYADDIYQKQILDRNKSIEQQKLDRQVAQERALTQNLETINNSDLSSLNYMDSVEPVRQIITPAEVDDFLKRNSINYENFKPGVLEQPKTDEISNKPQNYQITSTPSSNSFSGAFSPTQPQQQNPAPAQQQAPSTQAPAAQTAQPVAQQSTAPTTRAMSGPEYIQQKVASKTSVAPTAPKAQPETQVKGGVPIPVNTKSGLGF